MIVRYCPLLSVTLWQVEPNLRPLPDDVDFGAWSGLQFQQAGDSLAIPVRAHIAEGRLVTYQVDLLFDPEHLLATGCTGGQVANFVCTINDPLEMASLAAVDTSDSNYVTGARVLLGRVTLQVKATAITLISGTIVTLNRRAFGSSAKVGGR